MLRSDELCGSIHRTFVCNGEQLKKGKKRLMLLEATAHKDEIPLTIENVRKERLLNLLLRIDADGI
jgi:hypothetical protein